MPSGAAQGAHHPAGTRGDIQAVTQRSSCKAMLACRGAALDAAADGVVVVLVRPRLGGNVNHLERWNLGSLLYSTILAIYHLGYIAAI